MLLLWIAELAFGGKVLVTSGTNSTIISKITGHGHTVTTLSISSFASQSKSYFQGFDAIYIGDNAYPSSSDASALKASSGFGPALDGRIVLTGLHAEGHGKYDYPANAVDWVADGTGTGIVVLADWTGRSYDWLNQGTFATSSLNVDPYSHSGHPSYGGLASSYFVGWGQSIHYQFTSWPSDFASIGTSSGSHITIARNEKCKDGDGDGYRDKACGGDDCDDTRAAVRPGAPELCATTYDDDCDGSINEASATDASTWYRDADGDTYGNGSVTTKACTVPSGYVTSTTDCNDTDAFTYPGATETVGDEVDQSCDGKEVCFLDGDDDGYRMTTTLVSADVDCRDTLEATRTEPTGDCDDSDKLTYTGAAEIVADGKDQSCDGKEVCYQDLDNDKYRTGLTATSSDADCADAGEALLTVAAGDCDDADAASFPGAAEVVADGKDQSCDGRETCYVDSDDDGWRLTSTLVSADADCVDSGEALASEPTLDCDDADKVTYPGATEIVADGKDQSCDGKETCYQDLDGDKYRTTLTSISSDADCVDVGEALATVTSGDCDDSDKVTYPGAPETVADGKDQSCDGKETCYVDFDDDGWRLTSTLVSSDADCADGGEALASEPTLDCDDRDGVTYPGATEIVADGKDQSCDGEEICYEDLDLDKYRTSVTAVSADADCADRGEALASLADGDCDDADPVSYPGATEVIADEKDQSCDGGEICYEDLDGDTWRTDLLTVSTDADCRDIGEANRSAPYADCDDDEKTTYPGATEVPYDGVDQDCNGQDLCDADLDGYDADVGSCVGSDCDDRDPTINPRATEIWYDGLDQDCDAASDYDADLDGYVSVDYGGEDCDDTDFDVNPGVVDAPYDGIDADCDEASDFDADGDGFDDVEFGGEDCDDANPDIYPGAPELPDGIDNDCNGVDEDDDTDGDGIPDEVELDLGTDPALADSDEDGVYDGVEVEDFENPLDTDKDGKIDALDTDDDEDGVPTEVETGDTEPGSALPEYPDTDGDGTPDFRDTDSDDDGFSDEVEGQIDTDRDGTVDRLDADSDGDGVADRDELDADSDNDGANDRVDLDDDGDNLLTATEGDVDTDQDGTPDYLDPDSDDDGKPDLDEGGADGDCDEVANYLDPADFDGPCSNLDGLARSFQSAACAADSTGGAPMFLGALLALFATFGARRRQT